MSSALKEFAYHVDTSHINRASNLKFITQKCSLNHDFICFILWLLLLVQWCKKKKDKNF